MRTKEDLLKELKERLKNVSYFNSALAVLHWDQEVSMPPKGVNRRAETIAYLSSAVHQKFMEIDSDGVLSNLRKSIGTGDLSHDDEIIVLETAKSYDKAVKLPKEFVKELAETTSKAQSVWAEARKKSNFKLFAPWLKKIVELKRREASFLGYKGSPYDALLDSYEPGLTSDDASRILNDLKSFLAPFIKKTSKAKFKKVSFKGKAPVDKQLMFNIFISEKIGFDFSAGKIEKSTHPFTIGFHPDDVRFTTRYKEDNAMYAIGSTIHEAGHALYEQGLPGDYFGTPLGDSISLGIHESQSRFWENMIGKSLSFWKYFYPKFQKEFPKPFSKIKLKDFYNNINEVRPSLIRTEADEVTYAMHIILRFEIEKELIEGSIEVDDLPKIWNSKMKEYLGVKVPKDSLGVLQDVHWSLGAIGYFPSYVLGNLYAAQFYKRMKEDIPGMDKEMSLGRFGKVNEWLKKNIHAHGKAYTSDGLMKKLTGEPLNSRYFIEYLEDKYRSIC